MNFASPSPRTFVPDGAPIEEALRRVTHLAIGAHQDDLEFMAFEGICHCYKRQDLWFGGVVCTNGTGSPRSGKFASFDDTQLAQTRVLEQEEAARAGDYAAMIQFAWPSDQIKGHPNSAFIDDLARIVAATKARVVYTHNLADKHDTHIAVAVAVIEAIRSLPADQRPRKLVGCEVWRDLDWLVDNDKIVMDVSGYDELAEKLNLAFASQLAAKRYDLGVIGRRFANATFSDPHASDELNQAILGMDLTPLITDHSIDIAAYTVSWIDRFKSDVESRINRIRGI